MRLVCLLLLPAVQCLLPVELSPCERGSYSSTGSKPCTPCPNPLKTTAQEGSTSLSDCKIGGPSPLTSWGTAEYLQSCEHFCVAKNATCNAQRLSLVDSQAKFSVALSAAGKTADWCTGGYFGLSGGSQDSTPSQGNSQMGKKFPSLLRCYYVKPSTPPLNSTCTAVEDYGTRLCACDCPAGLFWDAKAISCSPCPAGTSTSGLSPGYGPAACQACPEGHYSTGVGEPQCTPCEGGKSSLIRSATCVEGDCAKTGQCCGAGTGIVGTACAPLRIKIN